MEIWNCFGLVESYQRIKLITNSEDLDNRRSENMETMTSCAASSIVLKLCKWLRHAA